MTPDLFFTLYFCFMGIITPIEEIWNYNNPRPYPHQEYLLINWEVGDFKKVDGKWVLMKKHMHDKPFKAKARKKYYNAN